MFEHLRILYIGNLSKHCNSYRRFATLQKICGQVDGINTYPYLHIRFFAGFQHHLSKGPGVSALNRTIRKALVGGPYDIILVDNKPYLNKKTISEIRKQQKQARLVNLVTDDPNGKFRRSWGLMRRTASLYDHHFVQRTVNIEELKSWGAPRIDLCYRSFDPEFHRPMTLTAAEREHYAAPVGFIGSYEDVRAGFIAHLIKNGIPVKVIGDGWEGGVCWDVIRPHYQGPSVYEAEYIKHISGMEIALHFLRHANRDVQDSRTFEIPACKVFMIAERTPLHESLFVEGEEAVFFDTKEELLEKVRYYLDQPALREKIAEGGYLACHNRGYDHRSRLEYVLSQIIK